MQTSRTCRGEHTKEHHTTIPLRVLLLFHKDAPLSKQLKNCKQLSSHCHRHIIQNSGFICGRICNALPGHILALRFALQLYHEAILHCQQLLHPVPHALPVQVRRYPDTSVPVLTVDLFI
jgi:hypothetical protein